MAADLTPVAPDDLTPLADCAACAYRDTLAVAGRCRQGDRCVRAESGRRIDRCFRANPRLAGDFTRDPF